MLLNAMHEHACLVLTTDAFPDEVKQIQWAEVMWQAACDDLRVHYKCSECMTQLVSLQHYYHSTKLNDKAA